jgi:hypothetical protein
MLNLVFRFMVVLTLLFASGCAFAQTKEPVMNGTREQTVSLLQYLYKLGDACDCFFTIEESWTYGEPMNSLASHLVPASTGTGDAQRELQRLTGIVPHLAFKVDSQNPAIFHVMDSRLARLQSYSMEQTVSSIDFTGKLNGLIKELSGKGISISPQTGFVAGDPLAVKMDLTTLVHVKEDRINVRVLLTDAIPLKNYSHVLWTASTERHPGAVTVVNFTGPRTTAGKP